MLNSVIRGSIRHRHAVAGAACLLLVHGIYVAGRAKLDVFPEFAPPLVFVHTEAPGLSPEEVESLVTRPVENAVNGTGDLESIRSQSIQGLSVVTATFRDGTDIHFARQRVSERLGQIAEDLPDGVRPPVLAPLTSSTSLALTVGLTSRSRTAMDLRTIADWTIRPRLLGVPGVASVVEFGGETRQIQVQVDPDGLGRRGVPLTAVLEAARRSAGIAGAGFVETSNQRIPVRVEGQPVAAADVAQAVVEVRGGTAVRLADVARVADGAEPKIGDAAIDGEPGVLLQVWSQFGANTLEVTASVEAALEDMRPLLESEGVVLRPGLFRPASFIETSIGNVRESMIAGGALVAVVLALFLFNLRTAFISLTAIPLSLLAAVVVLDALGATINTLTLGGLTIAIGEVVDDAIIDVENIHRRLRENQALERPRSAFRVIFDASMEVRSSVVWATVIVALVFLPVLTLSGVQGKLFAPLGIAYVLATIASLVVALTVTPALCALLLVRGTRAREPRHLDRLKAAHGRCLRWLTGRPASVLAATAVLCAGALALIPFLGGEFLPEFQEGHLIVQMSMVPGTSAPEAMRVGRALSRDLLAHPMVRSASLQVGRAELGEDTAGPEFGELAVALQPMGGEEEMQRVKDELRAILDRFPGVKTAVKPFLEERIEETLSGSRAEVVVRFYGDDLDVLEEVARDAESVLAGVRGAEDARFLRSVEPQVLVRLDPERLKRSGLRTTDVTDAVGTAYRGTIVSRVRDGGRSFPVAVILDPRARERPESIGEFILGSEDGRLVCLRDVAAVTATSGRHSVLHDGTRRYQEVSCNVEGRDLSSFVAEAKARLARELKMPPGVTAAWSGSGEEQARARREIILRSTFAGAAVLLVLFLVFRNARNLLLVLSNVPFALVGGVLAAFLAERELSLGSLVGFVTLFGITLRNSILMVSHFEHLVSVEGRPWGLDTALRGASERLVPVLMTALVTGLGILPIALGTGEAGREIEGPMAGVILGGLVTSTVLNLLVLPSLALRFGQFGQDGRPEGDSELTELR